VFWWRTDRECARRSVLGDLGCGHYGIVQHPGHMDGLCAGIAAMASVFFAMLAYLNGQTLVSVLRRRCWAAAGFRAGISSPHKIFMGDGGAMFLGFLMATLSLKLRLEHTTHFSAWLAPVLVLGATIFDTALVTFSRSRRGLLPFASPGKDHATHRLANLGLGQRGAVLTMYLLERFGVRSRFWLVIYQRNSSPRDGVRAAGGLIGVALLERAPYERQVKKSATTS